MPQKNTIKAYAPDAYYHIYTRGVDKQMIFADSGDYTYFIALFDRYLSGRKITSQKGAVYPDYSRDIQLVSFCLMKNHIHLLVHQGKDASSLQRFMSSVMTSYSKFFNTKHRRVGALFESRYKAKRIDNDAYLTHISRYIHMNPRRWRRYPYSSLALLYGDSSPPWLNSGIIYEQFPMRGEYLGFLLEYQKEKELLEEIKNSLADN